MGRPLTPVGQAFDDVGGKIVEAKKIEDIAACVEEVKSFTDDAESVANEVVKYVLEPLKAQPEDTQGKVTAMSTSNLLTLLPLPLLAYFGLMHLAFALAGLALLLV